MKPYNQLKIVIIGVGYLMEYIRPGYEKILGENVKTNIVGIKASDRDIERKRKELGYEIVVGGIPEVLKRVEPDLILLAPQPSKVKAIVENELKPYYQSLREANKTLPDLYGFAPDPLPRYYNAILGDDVNTVTLLPNMVNCVNNTDVGYMGYTITAFDENHPWPQEHIDLLNAMMQPVGQLAIVPQDTLGANLVGKVLSHLSFELNYAIQDGFAKHGINLGTSEIADCLRTQMIEFVPELPKGSFPYTKEGIPEPARTFVCKTAVAWYEGILQYAKNNNLEMNAFTKIAASKFALLLMSATYSTREQMEYGTACHATKGGVLERACECFAEFCREPMLKAIDDYMAGNLKESFWSELSTYAAKSGDEVLFRCNNLSKGR